MYILVNGKYGPTSFITQHAFFSALRVQCVLISLYLTFDSTTKSILLPAAIYTHPLLREFFLLSVALA